MTFGSKTTTIGERADLEPTAIRQRQIVGGQGGELANRIFDAQGVILAHVLREHASKITVRARMCRGQQEDPFGRITGFVGAETDPGHRDLAANVVLAHQEIGDANSGSIFDDQIDGRVLG